MLNSKRIPEPGQIVKVYYKEEKNGNGGFISSSEFGIVMRAQDNLLILKRSYVNYQLCEVDWFLEHTKIKFV